MTERVKAEEALRVSQTELRRLAARNITIQESERRRIARDLHDGLGQSLSLLKLGIGDTLRQMGASVPKETVESVKLLLPKVAGVLDELRRVCMDLRPSSLDDLGILPTFAWFVREFENVNLKTRIETHISANEKDIPEPLKIVIFRILQEAVNNAVKHAEAECITISLHNDAGALAFTVEDDGKGYDPSALARRSVANAGRGMQSMRERAELSGGTYTATSAVERGTKVCVVWPAEQTLVAQCTGLGAAKFANNVVPFQFEHKNSGKACTKVSRRNEAPPDCEAPTNAQLGFTRLSRKIKPTVDECSVSAR